MLKIYLKIINIIRIIFKKHLNYYNFLLNNQKIHYVLKSEFK